MLVEQYVEIVIIYIAIWRNEVKIMKLVRVGRNDVSMV